MTTLGLKIKEIRIAKGMTQIELAKDLCTPSMISQIESDKAQPSNKILMGIAKKLDVPVEELLGGVTMTQKSNSSYKMAQAMISGGHYTLAASMIKNLLELPLVPAEKENIMYDLAFCEMQTGNLKESLGILNQVIYPLDKNPAHKKNQLLFTKSHNLLGQVEFKAGRHDKAFLYWEKALQEITNLPVPDDLFKADIFFNMGNAHKIMGHIEDAIDCYNEASEIYSRYSNPETAGALYLELASSYQKLSDFASAQLYSEKAITAFSGYRNAHMVIKTQVLLASIPNKERDLEFSIHTVQYAAKAFITLGETEEAAEAYIALAKLYLEKGDNKGADEAAHEARNLLSEFDVKQAFVHRIYGTIFSRLGDYEKALQSLQKAAERFKHAGNIGDWIETMSEIARLYRDTQDLQKAFDTLAEIPVHTTEALRRRGIAL